MTIREYVKDRTFYLDIAVEAKGAPGDWIKALLERLSQDRQKEMIGQILRSLYGERGRSMSVQVSGVDDPRVPFKASAIIEFKDSWVPNTPTFTREPTLSPAVSFFTDLGSLPQPELRKNGYRSSFPFRILLEFVSFPPDESVSAEALPKAQSLDTPFFSFEPTTKRTVVR